LKGILRQLSEIDRLALQVAEVGVELIDRFRESRSPDQLQAIQDFIRAGLLAVEKRLGDTERRRQKRSSRNARLSLRNKASGRRYGEHIDAAKRRDDALRRYRSMLRQVGDACAWLVLGEDPRTIVPLFSDTRVHSFSKELGMIGPLELATRAHASGRFLVLENDLTRCLGKGDITVVRRDGSSSLPLAIEVKTSGEFKEGAQVEVNLFTAMAAAPEHEDLLTDFNEALDLRIRDDRRIPSNAVRQAEELKETVEVLLEIGSRGMELLENGASEQWQRLEDVLNGTMEADFSFQAVDEGVVFVAVRVRVSDDTETIARELQHQLGTSGFAPEDEKWLSASILDLQQHAWLSAFVLPIALWPIDKSLRAQLLSGQLYFQCIRDPMVWEKAFRRCGIELVRHTGGWRMMRGEEHGEFDALEVEKLEHGIVFSGVIPSVVAESVAKAFDRRQSTK
jgi:hypothetical protein